MNPGTASLRSRITDFLWPAMPSAQGAQLLAVLYQLADSEWWAAERLREHQLGQLSVLLAHAADTVPHYRERLADYGIDAHAPLTAERWRRLPLLTRRDIQAAGETLYSDADMRPFGGTFFAQTSGSTGEPVRVKMTMVDRVFWEANTLREHAWHQRDFSAKLASIRAFPGGRAAPPDGNVSPDWGRPVSELYPTGPMAVLSLDTDVTVQVRWLLHHEPDYLLTYPTNLRALIDEFAARGRRPQRLREVRSVGETLSPELREACGEAWGVPVTDVYSSRELGYIALQCPVSGLYHVTAETMLVEVLDAAGEPCRPGEVGRVVVTPLHNLATPLVRYEIGDYAEVGQACPCGRGLPTLARVLGRSRNMVRLPDGRRHWPLVGFDRFRAIAPLRQYQLVQRNLEQIEFRLVVDTPLSPAQRAGLTEVVREALGHPFTVDFTRYDGSIPRAAGGKYEEFLSLLDD